MKALVAMAILGFALPSMPVERKQPLVQPKETSLVLGKVERTNDLFAEFDGTTRISGTLVAEWIGGKNNLNYESPDYSLVPDPESILRLPHFSGYRVRFIELRNGPAALEMAAGKDKADRLLKRQTGFVRVTGSFVVEKYVVGVECDASWAKATMISADVPNRDFAAVLQPIETC